MFRRGGEKPAANEGPDRVDSVLGPGISLQGKLLGNGGVRIEGAVVTCDPASGRATAIEPVRVPWP